MDAIRKKMTGMKKSVQDALTQAEEWERQLQEVGDKADLAESKQTAEERRIHETTDELDKVQEKLIETERKVAEKTKQLTEAEGDANGLKRRIVLLQEDLARTSERMNTMVAQLTEKSGHAIKFEDSRKELEGKSLHEEHRAYESELRLADARIVAEDADRKFDEIARKLAVGEADVVRANKRCEDSENNIIELEDELRAVGTNLKTLELTEQKAVSREDAYFKQIKVLEDSLKAAESRAEYAERSVIKLQQEADRLEEGLLSEKTAYTKATSELDNALEDMV